MSLKKVILSFVAVIYLSLGLAQQKSPTVEDVLTKAQQVFTTTPSYAIDINYQMFGNYTKTVAMEAFDGQMVKANRDTYLKINNTIFLTSETKKTNVKVFEDEHVIEVSEKETNSLMTNSPVYIENFIKLFKNKTIVDKGDYYMCTLTTDVITQVPYGKIELFIDKDSYVITKQVLYFLAEYPFIDENGKQQKGNPKMVVTLSNFKKEISQELTEVTDIKQYITKTGDFYKPSATYKEFKIIQN
ncbi:MAG: hypothetical protein ACX93I_10085 [Winogradskyella sp.]